jgi:hypothetical protein
MCQRQSVQESLVLERVQLADRRNSQLRAEVDSLETELQRARSQVCLLSSMPVVDVHFACMLGMMTWFYGCVLACPLASSSHQCMMTLFDSLHFERKLVDSLNSISQGSQHATKPILPTIFDI